MFVQFNQSGNFQLSNSTLYGNSGINGGAILANSSNVITLSNSTLSGNSALGQGGGIVNIQSAPFTLVNTIFANSLIGGDCYALGASLTSDANSIIEDGSCNAAGIGARIGDSGLPTLKNNGGPTQTIALKGNNRIIIGLEKPLIDGNAGTHSDFYSFITAVPS